MNLLAVALSLLVGVLRGMRPADIAAYRWRGTGWFVASLALNALLSTSYAQASPALRIAAPLLNLTAFAFLLLAIWLNRELWGARLAFLGVFLNAIVVLANGGKMPVSLEAIRAVAMPTARLANLVAGRSLTHRLMRPTTIFRALGDIYILPPLFARSPVFSIGDVIIVVSLFVLVQEVMAYGAARRRAISYFLRQQYEQAKLRAAEEERCDDLAAETAPRPGSSPAKDAGPHDPPGGAEPTA